MVQKPMEIFEFFFLLQLIFLQFFLNTVQML